MLPPDYVAALGKLDKKGRTVLHIVINFNDRDHRMSVFRRFVEQGADLTMLDGKGHSLIDACFAAGREQMASYIERTLTQQREKARSAPPVVQTVEKKLPAPATAPTPAPAPKVETVARVDVSPMSPSADGWIKVSAHQVAKVETIPMLGYRLTDIFNFQTGERLSLSRNLDTQVETRESMPLSAVPQPLLLQAVEYYQAQGGKMACDTIALKTGGAKLLASAALPLLRKN